MRKLIACIALLSFSTLVVADEKKEPELKTYDDVIKAQIKGIETLVEIFDEIKTAEDIKKAEPKVDKLIEHMKKVQKRMKVLGKPSKEEETKLKAKYAKKLKGLSGKMIQGFFRVSKIEGGKELLQRIQKIGQQ